MRLFWEFFSSVFFKRVNSFGCIRSGSWLQRVESACRAGPITEEHRLSSCDAQAQQLQHSGLVAPRQWDLSSPTRPRTCVPWFQGGFLITGPPGKKSLSFLYVIVKCTWSQVSEYSITSWSVCCPNSYVEVRTSSSSECDLVWRQDPCRGDQVKVSSLR